MSLFASDPIRSVPSRDLVDELELLHRLLAPSPEEAARETAVEEELKRRGL